MQSFNSKPGFYRDELVEAGCHSRREPWIVSNRSKWECPHWPDRTVKNLVKIQLSATKATTSRTSLIYLMMQTLLKELTYCQCRCCTGQPSGCNIYCLGNTSTSPSSLGSPEVSTQAQFRTVNVLGSLTSQCWTPGCNFAGPRLRSISHY